MNLNRRLQHLINVKAKQLDVDPSWLKYAKRAELGYKFLPTDSSRDTVLIAICHQAATEFPNLTPGEIQDALAKLVNK